MTDEAYDWANVLPHGMIEDLVNETGLLTPEEARDKAANLLSAAEVAERIANSATSTMKCKHCGLTLNQDDYGNWRHAEGVQRGKGRCGIEPYGFLAEPVGTPCSDHPANPCNGSRGLVPVTGDRD